MSGKIFLGIGRTVQMNETTGTSDLFAVYAECLDAKLFVLTTQPAASTDKAPEFAIDCRSGQVFTIVDDKLSAGIASIEPVRGAGLQYVVHPRCVETVQARI